MQHTKLNMACKLTKALSRQRIKKEKEKAKAKREKGNEGESRKVTAVSCVTSCTFY